MMIFMIFVMLLVIVTLIVCSLMFFAVALSDDVDIFCKIYIFITLIAMFVSGFYIFNIII